MDLERVAAVIRPRTPWEAVDLGFRMARSWWLPVYRPWLVTVVPVWTAIAVLLSGYPLIAALLLWWLMPLFDRVPLFVVSRALFGATPKLAETMRALPGLWSPRAIFAAIFLRFDPMRSFNQPVRQLEGLRGTALSQRCKVLRQEGANAATWLTVACLHMEIFFFIALFALLAQMVPETVGFNLWAQLGLVFEGEFPRWFFLFLAGLGLVAHSLVEPFYVAGGFALYLDRRTRLEGWHIELAFRRLARRLTSESAARRTGGRVAALVLLSLAIAAPDSLGAQPPEAAEADPQEAIAEILDQSEFQTRRTVVSWRLRGVEDEDGHEPPRPLPDSQPTIFSILMEGLAAIVEIILWVAVAGATLYLIVRLVRRMPHFESTAGAKADKEATPIVFGDAVTSPEALPDDVPAAALALWRSGRQAEALGLLYRGALVALVRDPELRVKESWTEGDCLHFLTERLSPDRADFFNRLTAAWQSAAYAHRPPAEDDLRALCSGWYQYLGMGGGVPPCHKGGSRGDQTYLGRT